MNTFARLGFVAFLLIAGPSAALPPLPLASQRELLADNHLIASFDQVTLKMHQPVAWELALVCDAPWEGNTSGSDLFALQFVP